MTEFRIRLLEERQGVGVSGLVVQEARVDVGGHRQGRVGLVRELGFVARDGGLVPYQGDVREHFVRRCTQSSVVLVRHARGQLRVPARLLHLANLEQRVCRGDVAVGVRRSQLDEMFVRVDRLVPPIGADGEDGKLVPDAGEFGLVAKNLA